MEKVTSQKEIQDKINKSPFISRDLSWLKFNYRVLHQTRVERRSILERLKFLAITSSNLDEFLMIRVGSLYNYLDFNRKRIDYCGLREWPFKERLFQETLEFAEIQNRFYKNYLEPKFKENGFGIRRVAKLSETEKRKVRSYFSKAIFPMLTPMVFDSLHPFPILMNKLLIFGVVTKASSKKDPFKYSFIQIPANLPRFYEVHRKNEIIFVPIESIIEDSIQKLYKNVEILSVTLFRITRNGDFDYDDYDESEVDFVEEIQRKLKKRKTGRVVRLEIAADASKKMMNLLTSQFDIDEDNIFRFDTLLDYTGLWQIVGHSELADLNPEPKTPVRPLNGTKEMYEDMLEYVAKNDLFMHHPYNSMDPLIALLDQAANDKNVLAIKITIYRLAKNSAISEALLRAAEKGKHVSVLFEVKARFDEENNIKEAQKLQRAGCFVVYGIKEVKTHTKLLLIVRKQKNSITTYVHMSSGNYNEQTAKLYSDTSLLTAKRIYGTDVSEFFNVITGHSKPTRYKKLITAPGDMRKKLITLIRKEVSNKRKKLSSGIVIKVNSLEDRHIIDELYKASKAGVQVRLIVRGICCLRPGRKGLSENIRVKSIVGDFLEHSRLYYFENAGDPKIYGGSADIMVRSFERRIESLFLIEGSAKQEAINILVYNLKDELNSFILEEDGSFEKVPRNSKSFDCHREFYNVTQEIVDNAKIDWS